MHKRSQGSQALVPFDPEIEAAARRRSREARRKKRPEVSMVEDPNVLRDYALPQAWGISSSIVTAGVEANNFELSLALISFVEREQFAGYHLRTPTLIFTSSLRTATPLRSVGRLAMLSDCGSSLSH